MNKEIAVFQLYNLC